MNITNHLRVGVFASLLSGMSGIGCGPGLLEDNAPDATTTDTPSMPDAGMLPDAVEKKDVFINDAAAERPVIGNPPSLTVRINRDATQAPIYRGGEIKFHPEATDSDGTISSLTYRIGTMGIETTVSLDDSGWMPLAVPCEASTGALDVFFSATDNNGNSVTTRFPLMVDPFQMAPETTPLLRNQRLCEDTRGVDFEIQDNQITLNGVATRNTKGEPQTYYTLYGNITAQGQDRVRIQDIVIYGMITLLRHNDGSRTTGATLRNVAITTTEAVGLRAVGMTLNVDTLSISGTAPSTSPTTPPNPAQGLLHLEECQVGNINSLYLSNSTGTAISWIQSGGIATSRPSMDYVNIQNAGIGFYFIGAPLAPLDIPNGVISDITECAFRVERYDRGSNPVVTRLGAGFRFGDNVNQEFCGVSDPAHAFPRVE